MKNSVSGYQVIRVQVIRGTGYREKKVKKIGSQKTVCRVGKMCCRTDRR